MNISQRLRKLADSTGLDAFGDEIRAIADEMDEQPADVTDERQAFEKWLGIRPCGAAHDLAWSAWKARAILALRPVQVPMTDEQVISEANEAFDTRTDMDDETLVNKYGHGVYISRFLDFARSIEAHHGISAQAKKEQA